MVSLSTGVLSNITINECESIERMAKNAAKIAFYNFKWQFVTIVLFETKLMCGVSAFLQSYKKNVAVATINNNLKFSMSPKQFVVFGSSLVSLGYLIQWTKQQKFDTTARYLIVCQSNKKRKCDEVSALDYLWHHQVMNVIFINDIYNNGTAAFYYEYGEECKNTPPINVIDWDSCAYTNESRYCADKFPMPFRNMYGCPLVVSTFMQPPYMYIEDGVPSGADGDLLRIIIGALNATLVLMLPHRGDGWGNIDDNGTWVGSLSDLFFDLANISMTSASITQARYSAFELTNFYYTTTLVWVTHPPQPEPYYYKLLHPFKMTAWIASGLSFLFVAVLAVSLKSNLCSTLWHKLHSGRISDRVIFLSWQICMGQAVTIYPLKMTVLYLISFWVWYCFLMRTFYQVHLINSLKTDVYPKELTSIEDYIAAGYSFGGGLALNEYYKENPLVYNNWEGINSSNYTSLMYNMTQGYQFVLAANIAAVQEFLKSPERKLYILPQPILVSPVGIFLKQFSPLTSVINSILEKLFEFGFPQMLFKNHTMSRFIQKSADEKKPIKLIYFTGCYILLLVGWILSFLIFIIEICIKQRRDFV